MGTQQILMIVLSVIVVGAAVAVGIQMFDTQSNNLARMAVTSEISKYAILSQAWFRTPKIMGGGEGAFETGDLGNLMRFINEGNDATTITTASGQYVFAATGVQVTITGTSPMNPRIGRIVGTINMNGTDVNPGDRGISIVHFPDL